MTGCTPDLIAVRALCTSATRHFYAQWACDALAQSVLEVVLHHAPDFDGATMEMRASSTGKYISLTCTINATSKPQLDALYRELSSHPLVKVVL